MKTRECIKWLWNASYGMRSRIAVCALVGALHVAASMTFVWVCKQLVDSATSGIREDLTLYVSTMAGCMLMQILLSAVEQRIANLSDVTLKNRLRHKLFVRLMESRWDGKETFHTGDTLNRVMEDVRVVSESLVRSVPAVISAGIQFVAAFSFLFILKPGLAWTVPGIMVTMLIVSKAYIRKMRKLTKDIRVNEGRMQSLMQESLQHRIVIHTLEKTPYISDALSERQDDLRERVMDKTSYSIFTRSFIHLGFSAGYAAAFLWGVFGIMDGTATFGMMTAFIQLVGQIQRPVMNLSHQLPPLVNSITSAERLVEIESRPSEESGEPLMMGEGIGIRFRDVNYSYPDSEREIICGLSHDFKPGTVTALVGETGAGKSTVMRLILGLLRPDTGAVSLYDGHMEAEASPRTRCNIVYVPQGNTLMSGTIRENLFLGDPKASEEQLRQALYLAAADFVYELPEGLDTICGEGGAGVSEGQAQRIAIARSLLKKGGVLLLDEPTASLDPQTEKLMLDRLKEGMTGRTMIIVTHREAAMALCDDVLSIA